MWSDLGMDKNIWQAVIPYQDWKHIKILNLRYNKINSNTIKVLLNVEWPNLAELDLSNAYCYYCLETNCLNDIGVKNIVQKEWK